MMYNYIKLSNLLIIQRKTHMSRKKTDRALELMKPVDETDMQILDLLRENARMSLKDISSSVHLTSPAVSARIEKLEAAGLVKGYHADIDLEQLGYKIKSFIMISVEPEDHVEFYSFVRNEECVLECSHITGNFSMLLKVVFSSTSDLDRFVGRLQQFGKTETQVVFSTVLERH